MLNEIFLDALSVYTDRNIQTTYSGMGTTHDRLVDEYLLAGGSFDLLKSVQALAWVKAQEV